MRFTDLNKIPVRTGNKLGVNEITIDMTDVQIEKFEALNIESKEVKGLEIKALDKSDERLKVALKYGVGAELMKEADENFTNGVLITLADNTVVEENIVLVFTMDQSNKTLVDNLVVVAGKNSKANIIVKYISDENLEGYHNGIARVFADENSNVKVSKVNLLGKNVRTFDSNVSEIKDNAKADFIAVELGGKSAVSNYEGILLGEKSKGDLLSVYIGSDDEKLDLNYVLTIKGAKAEGNMDVKGALKDKAVKNFKGTLDFKRGAKGSKAAEEEYCMLLSEKSRSRSVPLLLCDEDDVAGEHAAASGSIDENKLFYLMSRGISYDEARLLIINAAFNPIVDEIGHEEIQNEILDYIKGRLA